MSFEPEVDTEHDHEYLIKHQHNVKVVTLFMFILRMMYHLLNIACLVGSFLIQVEAQFRVLFIAVFVCSLFLHDAYCCFKHSDRYNFVAVSVVLFIFKLSIITLTQSSGFIYMTIGNVLFHSLFDGMMYLISSNKKLVRDMYYILPFQTENDYEVVLEEPV